MLAARTFRAASRRFAAAAPALRMKSDFPFDLDSAVAAVENYQEPEPAPPAMRLPPHVALQEIDPAEMTAERMRAELMDEDEPAVFRGAGASWPAVSGERAWSDWDSMGERFGDRMVSVEQGEVFYSADALAGVRVPFGLYLIYMHAASDPERLRQLHAELPKMYMGQSDLFQDVPELAGDVEAPAFAVEPPAGRGPQHLITNAWFGRPGQISPIHFDPQHNLLCQVAGYKLCLLYPPETDVPRSLPQGAGANAQRNISDVIDPRNDDDGAAAGLAAITKPLAVVLGPGDAVFIPRKWWHFCAAVDGPSLEDAHSVGTACPSMGVNFWWPEPR